MSGMKYRKTTDDEFALIIDEGEGYMLEYKRSVNSDLSKELVAFANASGGRIVIGFDDNGEIAGIDISNKTISRIEDMATSCDPPAAIKIEKLLKHKLLVIHISEGSNRPHRCSKDFYLRNGTSSQKMSTADITAFIQAEGKVRFDEQLRTDLDCKKVLDEKRLKHFLNLSKISDRGNKEDLLFNLDAGDFKDNEFYFNSLIQ